MRTVWKYTLRDQDTTIEMPIGATILHVREQHGCICMWALVDSTAEKERRSFLVTGTGHEIKSTYTDLEYVGSALVDYGTFVFHVFEHKHP